MSHENAEVVRHPIALKARSRRGFEERLYLRFPSVVTFVIRYVWPRLPRRSWPRRALLLRFAYSGFHALNRGDFESSFLLYRADCEMVTPPSLVEVGFDPVYRGREGRFEFQRRWNAEWGEMRFEPEEVLDLGDRVLFVGHFKGSGLSSGAGFEGDWANLLTISAGRIVREQSFFDTQEALETAGLKE